MARAGKIIPYQAGIHVPYGHPGSDALLLLKNGTLSRSSEAYALGSDALLDQYAANELRTEYRSDLGLYLLEGERTNLLTRSEEFDHADWDIGVSTLRPTITANAEVAPDGTTTADLVDDQDTSNDDHVQQSFTLPDTTTTYTLSVYAKQGTSDRCRVQLRTEGGGGTTRAVTVDLANGAIISGTGKAEFVGNGWYRVFVSAPRTAGTSTTGIADIFPNEAGGTPAGSVYFWGAQLEEKSFPTSYIKTVSAAATRAADTLTVASGDIPERVLSGKFTQQFRPYAASSDLVSGDEQWLLSVGGGNDGIRIRHDGTNVLLEYGRGGAVITASTALTYNRHQLMSYTLDHSTGDLTASGATSGNGTTTGTAGSWTAATMRVGGVQAGANEAFMGLGNLEKAA